MEKYHISVQGIGDLAAAKRLASELLGKLTGHEIESAHFVTTNGRDVIEPAAKAKAAKGKKKKGTRG